MKSPVDEYAIDRVREKRIEEKMSQATLAACLGVSRGFIVDIENPNKRAKYNLKHLNDIAHLFSCSRWDFLPEHTIVPNKGVLE